MVLVSVTAKCFTTNNICICKHSHFSIVMKSINAYLTLSYFHDNVFTLVQNLCRFRVKITVNDNYQCIWLTCDCCIHSEIYHITSIHYRECFTMLKLVGVACFYPQLLEKQKLIIIIIMPVKILTKALMHLPYCSI